MQRPVCYRDAAKVSSVSYLQTNLLWKPYMQPEMDCIHSAQVHVLYPHMPFVPQNTHDRLPSVSTGQAAHQPQ